MTQEEVRVRCLEAAIKFFPSDRLPLPQHVHDRAMAMVIDLAKSFESHVYRYQKSSSPPLPPADQDHVS